MRPIAIIAGNGALPLEIADALTSKGQQIYVIGVEGEAEPAIVDYPHSFIPWGKVGRLFRVLREQEVERLVLAGGVVGRPKLKLSMLDLGALRTLPGILAAMLDGDNTLLSSVVSVFEKNGFSVLNIAELLPQLAVERGTITKIRPTKNDLQRLIEGSRVTRALGAHDIGQACVVVGRRAVAVEGVEGTDGMLRRVADLRKAGRLPRERAGVLVKSLKPGQDQRADLPTIGPDTISHCDAAGLRGIGVDAGKTLIVERKKTLSLANELGIFIHGLPEGADRE